MSWIDVAILALVVLVGLLGVLKGVKKGALSLGAFLISFLLAFFLANVIAEALLGIDGVKDFVLGNGVGKDAQWSLAKWIYGGVGKMQLDEKSYLFTHFYKPMYDVVTSAKTAAPDANAGFALYGAFMIFSAICGLGIFIVVRLLLIIVTVIVKSYIGKKKTVLSRLFGFVLGALQGALWVFAFTLVFSCLGGYTFVSGIKSIQDEYSHNAVVCNYFQDWSYGLRNKLFLPDKNAYGRLVDMVYKKESTESANTEKLAGDELKMFISVSNFNYDGSPWSIDAKKKRKFDDSSASIKLRVGTEFRDSGMDAVAQAILDYNKSVADKIDGKQTGLTSAQFTTYNGVATNIDALMNDLWSALRQYELHCTTAPDKDQDNWESTLDSTLVKDYNAINTAIVAIKTKYEPLAATFGEFPEYELPERVKAADVPVSAHEPTPGPELDEAE